jgi:AbrB family looped-hinge helix DNA binding protein
MQTYLVDMKAFVSEDGQVTIPRRLRTRLGIEAGDVLSFEEENGHLVVSKVPAGTDPVDAFYGIIELDQSVDEFVAEARGRATP